MSEGESQEIEKSQEDFNQQLERAQNADINIPNWVRPEHVQMYKIAYTQVKEDETLSQLPSARRRKAIFKIMNKIIINLQDYRKQKKDERDGTRKESTS